MVKYMQCNKIETDNHFLLQLKQQLDPPLTRLYTSGFTIKWLCPPKKNEDDTAKLLVSDVTGTSVAVILISNSSSPKLVARGMKIAEAYKTKLGSELGEAIIQPLLQGELESGESYAITPFYKSFNKNKFIYYIQKRLLQKYIFDWLKEATNKTLSIVPANEIESMFITPLKYLYSLGISEEINNTIQIAINRINSSQWTPFYSFFHGDLWKDNILLNNGNYYNHTKIIIIDWPGSLLKGYAFFDLVRLSIDFNINDSNFINEVHRHIRILRCEEIDSLGYLLAGLGHMGTNLEHFPEDKYNRMINNCFSKLKTGL